ncbi:MAG: hypothetical protein CBC25_00690 [Pelagibacteraceae bacterium TMED65]|nr:MAG: hypothetical protein CBC25_00690 [Pelagibacteraceae bacterium TMED65]|tara:strand:- start:11345 stop:12277 length:933 start_codon:yes stop_codon:yes gene_type:complete
MKNLIKNFFRNLIAKENTKNQLQIGSSHFSLARQNYKKYENLHEADYKVFSQTGEDGIIDYLIYSLKIKKPSFIEIGVGDYHESNTKYLFERYSSRGAIIDMIDNLEKKVSKSTNLWKGDLKIIQSSVSTENINDVLEKTKLLKDLDLFSLDIDGIDYWIIEKIPENISKIFVAEYNPNFGYNKKITVPNIKKFNRTNYHYSNLCYGMSLPALVHIMKKKNFTFVGSNIACHNAFFISNNYISNISLKLPEENNLKEYVENNFRESRAKNYKLSFLSGEDKLKMISNCEVIDLSVSKDKSDLIKNIFKIN